MQRVEGVEELFLGVFLTFDELNVVHKDEIGGPVAVTEGLHAVLADGTDQIVGEGLGGDVEHLGVWIDLKAVMADGLHEMGFAEAHPSADEQRIEFSARGLSHSECSGMGHAAVGPHNEAIEHVTHVQPRQTTGRPCGWGGWRQ
ncbi:MAG: Uncharacterised protein [Cyanobium sp. ARS6]|nr:MAG: Uncharacterised protein [Cyanobium sp. ARS6]